MEQKQKNRAGGDKEKRGHYQVTLGSRDGSIQGYVPL